jgi:hypothetical protein
MTAQAWCGRAAGIDNPTWVMATNTIAVGTRYSIKSFRINILIHRYAQIP